MKRTGIRLTVLVTLGLLFVMLVPGASAQDAPLSTRVVKQIETIQALTSELRGLETLRPVDQTFITPEERAEMFTGGVSWFMREFYLAFDFIAPEDDLDYVIATLDAQTEAGGFYRHGSDTVTILLYSVDELRDNLPLRERIVYAHEFTHALQDQHFGLSRVITANAMNADETRGVIGLIEGDATFTMQEYALAAAQHDPAALDILELDLLGFGEYGPDIPEIFRENTYLTYLDGMNFVKALYAEGGYAAINAAYRNPPRSSEQILHPERYFSGDRPQRVYVDDPRAALAGSGWEFVDVDTLGEFYVRQILATQLDPATVDVAAEGWGGDQYFVYSNALRQQQAFLARIAWDTPEDSAEFAAAYRQVAALRSGTSAQQIDGTTTCWTGADEALCLMVNVEASGDVMISLAPTLDEAVAMFATQS